jgi:hypothetical protein
MKQTIIHFDGTETVTEIAEMPELDVMQKIVGGYIQICPQTVHVDPLFVVNEDGIAMGLPYNRVASTRYSDLWLRKYKWSELSEERLRLYGVVIVYEGTPEELHG